MEHVMQGASADEAGHIPVRETVGRRLVFVLGMLVLVIGCGLGGFLFFGGRAGQRAPGGPIPLRADLAPDEKMTACIDPTDLAKAFRMYAELTGRILLPQTTSPLDRLDDFLGRRLSRWHLVRRTLQPGSEIQYHRDGRLSAGEVKEELETLFRAAGFVPMAVGARYIEFVYQGAPTLIPETRSR